MELLVRRGVLAEFEPAVAGDTCHTAARRADDDPRAAILKEHCDATGVAAVSIQAQERAREAQDGSDLLPDHAWAENLEPGSNEYHAVQDLRDIAAGHPDAFEIIRQFAMLSDGITNLEGAAIDIMRQCIEGFPAADPSLLEALSQTWWRQTEDIVHIDVIHPLALALEAGCQQAFLDALRNQPSWEIPEGPTPTPRPTLGPMVPVSDLQWTKDGLTELERAALSDLETFEQQYPEMAAYVLSYEWVHDGITEDEQTALRHLLYVTRGGRSTLSGALSDENYRQVVDSMRRHYYLMDGISPADVEFLELVTEQFIQDLMVAIFVTEEPVEEAAPTSASTATPAPSSPSVPSSSSFAWVQDGLTDTERQALEHLQTIENEHTVIAPVVLRFTWVSGGITDDERRALGHFEDIGWVLESGFRDDGVIAQEIRDGIEESRMSDGISGEDLEILAEASQIRDPGTLFATILTLWS